MFYNASLAAPDIFRQSPGMMGSGGGSVGRVVASNSRGPRFESSHRQKFILNIYCQLY